ncbi:glucose-6-phosphate dehydrogenase [Desulfofustis glycolicus]|uniref:Glucose-6-phosphate 1-dehydrogenase n=1 Tax=Desulfofustis glycolicus DSM 9705 TaxID=1121409 RepID=A0A1M5V812_9BACT|nr:glucose-6-phosphate dehydrogenase [Desulfofustis glycolicus]MCB2214917.1 glucose-6-phosphate dehydrogenase [Desulfobulbaceae bacterium]SHH71356.1 glucose-6-phosphate 1-dehydrogenase [Desulfofustis glycolicus DSM 9705]
MTKPEPQMIVIFGATGDLARRKLLPGLLRLLRRGEVTDGMPIVCLGRRDILPSDFLERLQVERFLPGDEPELIERFSRLLHYRQFDLQTGTAEQLTEVLQAVARDYRCGGNKLFYLALPTGAFGAVADLIKPLVSGDGWLRVVFEKPFGADLDSAKRLNDSISAVLREEDIFRVDHYLGKELVQNILFLRFANEIFCCAWNRDAIDNVQITVSETLGVEERAGYYDHSGAIRDMLQNHLLQLLSFTAMEPPTSNDPDAIRDEAARVVEHLRPPETADVVLGQYGAGRIGDRDIRAYRDEDGVAPESVTETYVALRTFVDTPRWQGVPFYLRTGKRLAHRYAEIRIVYKQHRCDGLDTPGRANMIVIRIQPDEGIALAFNVRKPGSDNEAESVLMDFCHHCHFGPNTPEAYEAIMASAMRGDTLLFTRWDWLRASWRFIDRLRAVAPPVVAYQPGSTGPAEGERLPEADQRAWVETTPATRRVSVDPSAVRPTILSMQANRERG